MSENRTELMMYQTEDGQTKIDVRMENETVWLSLDQMAELFQRDKSTISRHIRNIFAEGELDREAVVAKFATTASDGKTYQVDFYNLDVIISVGYRVRSLRGTQFRIWANSVLKEYLIKGFAMNDDRLKDTAAKIILTNCWSVSGISVPPRRYSGAKFWTSMPPVLTILPTHGKHAFLSDSTEQDALCCHRHDCSGADRQPCRCAQTPDGNDRSKREPSHPGGGQNRKELSVRG